MAKKFSVKFFYGRPCRKCGKVSISGHFDKIKSMIVLCVAARACYVNITPVAGRRIRVFVSGSVPHLKILIRFSQNTVKNRKYKNIFLRIQIHYPSKIEISFQY